MKKSYSVSFSFNSRDNKSNVCLLTVIAVKFINNNACCCCCYCCYSAVIFRGLQNNLSDMFSIRSSHRRCFVRKVFLKISKKLSVKTSARASFLIKLQGLQLYLKRVFLQILQNFEEFIFYRTPPHNCFYSTSNADLIL